MRTATRVAAAIALGAGGMYWFDPRTGRRRRRVLADKATHFAHRLERSAEVAARDLWQRGHGARVELLGRLRQKRVDDDIVLERVRSRLGRLSAHPRAIEVHVSQGTVRLDGPILGDERERVIAGVLAVPGVTGVEPRLEVHAWADAPGLQGGQGVRNGATRLAWSPAARLLAGGAAVALVFSTLLRSRRRGAGVFRAVAGAALLLRSVANEPLARLLGVSQRHSLEIHKTLRVHAPASEVFAFFRELEGFPLFMKHVRQVKRVGQGRYHWKVDGPSGMPIEWDAVLTDVIPNERISWASTEGAAVPSRGTVRFESMGDGSTLLHIHLTYEPPAGAVGYLFAKVLGADPKKEIDDDLLRFKSLLELGRATGRHGPITLSQLRDASRHLQTK